MSWTCCIRIRLLCWNEGPAKGEGLQAYSSESDVHTGLYSIIAEGTDQDLENNGICFYVDGKPDAWISNVDRVCSVYAQFAASTFQSYSPIITLLLPEEY